MRSILLAVGVAVVRVAGAEPNFCSERPQPGMSSSIGRPSRGSLVGAFALVSTSAVRLLPKRHALRCLNWGTPRLIAALERAGGAVQAEVPGSPPLGVGDISKARGGPIRAYSKSHQAGRDVDLAFYAVDQQGRPSPLEDLAHFDAEGVSQPLGLRFDAHRTWTLVRALLRDPDIEVEWMFISRSLKRLLINEAAKQKASAEELAKAERVLHQPSDAPAHDDHIHLRIRCAGDERARGCRG